MFYRVSNGGSGEITIPISISWSASTPIHSSSGASINFPVTVSVGDVTYTFNANLAKHLAATDWISTSGSDSRTITVTPS